MKISGEIMTRETNRMKNFGKQIDASAKLAEKYFEDVKVTGEGLVYFDQGHYIYAMKYGYKVVFHHKKVLGKFGNLDELELFFQKKTTGVKNTIVKKSPKKSSPKKSGMRNTLWKNDTRKPSSSGDSKEWKGQVERAEELGISNISQYGRKQASYIIHLAMLGDKVDANKGKGYSRKKLDSMGVQFGVVKKTASASSVKELEKQIALLTK